MDGNTATDKVKNGQEVAQRINDRYWIEKFNHSEISLLKLLKLLDTPWLERKLAKDYLKERNSPYAPDSTKTLFIPRETLRRIVETQNKEMVNFVLQNNVSFVGKEDLIPEYLKIATAGLSYSDLGKKFVKINSKDRNFLDHCSKFYVELLIQRAMFEPLNQENMRQFVDAFLSNARSNEISEHLDSLTNATSQQLDSPGDLLRLVKLLGLEKLETLKVSKPDRGLETSRT